MHSSREGNAGDNDEVVATIEPYLYTGTVVYKATSVVATLRLSPFSQGQEGYEALPGAYVPAQRLPATPRQRVASTCSAGSSAAGSRDCIKLSVPQVVVKQ